MRNKFKIIAKRGTARASYEKRKERLPGYERPGSLSDRSCRFRNRFWRNFWNRTTTSAPNQAQDPSLIVRWLHNCVLSPAEFRCGKNVWEIWLNEALFFAPVFIVRGSHGFLDYRPKFGWINNPNPPPTPEIFLSYSGTDKYGRPISKSFAT